MSTLFEDNSKSIGKTPIVKLNRVTNGNVYAKVEARNQASVLNVELAQA